MTLWSNKECLESSRITKKLHGKCKGIKRVLQEPGLWWEWRADGCRSPLECSTIGGHTGCDCDEDGKLSGGCCARVVLTAEPDLLGRKGRLEEELLAEGHEAIFYPKFHCELNFIERFWCAAKFYARENCQYSLAGLRETLPAALHSVTGAAIYNYYAQCMKILEAYRADQSYGTKEFQAAVHKTHRRIEDKSKW